MHSQNAYPFCTFFSCSQELENNILWKQRKPKKLQGDFQNTIWERLTVHSSFTILVIGNYYKRTKQDEVIRAEPHFDTSANQGKSICVRELVVSTLHTGPRSNKAMEGLSEWKPTGSVKNWASVCTGSPSMAGHSSFRKGTLWVTPPG